MPYIGGASPDSQVGTSAAYRSQSYTSTAGQTTFTVDGGYTPGFIDVYVNGIKQVNGVDVTATNGTTVVFASALSAGYTVEVQALRNIAVNATSLPVASIAFSDGTVLNSAWGSVGYVQHTGTGTQTAFSTSPYTASSVNYTSVYISGVYQRKNTYTWAGSTLTFTSAPPNGAAIEIVINLQTTQVGVPSYGTVTPNSLSVGGPYWDSSGNLGVGTTSPISILDVYSATGANFYVRGDAGTNITANRYSTDANPPNINLRKGRGTNNSPTAVASNDSLGNLWFSAYGGTNFRNLSYVASRVSTYTSDTDISSFLTFGTSPSGSAAATERMRIDSSGNLLVGTTNIISAKVNVLGTAGGIGYCARVSTNGDYGMVFQNPSGTAVGSIAVNASTTAYNTSSDYRLKENIKPMTAGLTTISALKPVTYDWISDKSDGEGFIAHELQAIIPHAVTGEKDAVNEDGSIKPQGIDYSKIVVHLVAALQELSQKVDAQASEINKLKSALNGV